MFILQESPIDCLKAKSSFENSNNGAFVYFEGLVRNDKVKNKEVSSLFYTANSSECNTEGNIIVSQAIEKFHLNGALCIQRIGQVEVGQMAIWIGAWSSHRNEAFEGCRSIIEETKKRLLIWKKEFYKDGTSAWIPGKQTPVII
jgi:molybdopterin synthase catalytic subunit